MIGWLRALLSGRSPIRHARDLQEGDAADLSAADLELLMQEALGGAPQSVADLDRGAQLFRAIASQRPALAAAARRYADSWQSRAAALRARDAALAAELAAERERRAADARALLELTRRAFPGRDLARVLVDALVELGGYARLVVAADALTRAAASSIRKGGS